MRFMIIDRGRGGVAVAARLGSEPIVYFGHPRTTIAYRQPIGALNHHSGGSYEVPVPCLL